MTMEQILFALKNDNGKEAGSHNTHCNKVQLSRARNVKIRRYLLLGGKLKLKSKIVLCKLFPAKHTADCRNLATQQKFPKHLFFFVCKSTVVLEISLQ